MCKNYIIERSIVNTFRNFRNVLEITILRENGHCLPLRPAGYAAGGLRPNAGRENSRQRYTITDTIGDSRLRRTRSICRPPTQLSRCWLLSSGAHNLLLQPPEVRIPSIGVVSNPIKAMHYITTVLNGISGIRSRRDRSCCGVEYSSCLAVWRGSTAVGRNRCSSEIWQRLKTQD